MLPASDFLDPAVPVRRVEEAVAEDWSRLTRSEFRLALGLRRLYRDYAHRRDGRGRFVDWAEDRFGVPAKLASTFSFLGEHFERLPVLRAAVEAGEVAWTKAREFAALATEKDVAEWIAYAKGHTNRELERRLADRQGEPAKQISVPLTATQVQEVRRAREILTRETKKPVAERDLLPTMSKMLAEGTLVLAGKGPAAAPAKPVRPYLSMNLCVNCLDTWIPIPGENLRIPIEQWLAELKAGATVVDLLSQYLCDCPDVKHRRDRCPHRRPPLRPVADASRYVREEDLRIIEARDGGRCSTPGCGGCGPLDLGHLRPFREGYPAVPANLRQQGSVCNQMIESGRLLVTGEAPFEEYRTASGEYLGIGYDPRRRRAPEPESAGPENPHVGNGKEGREKAPGGAGDAA